MEAILVLFLALFAGWGLKLRGLVDESAVVGLNRYVIYVALPALVLVLLPGLHVGRGLWVAASMAWLHFGLAWLVFRWLGRWFGWDRATVGALILTGGLGNTSFLGLPMIQAFWGEADMAIGVVADQLGSFLVLSTLGLLVAARASGTESHWRRSALRIATFPPFIALVAAVLWPWPFPEPLQAALAKLGATLAPVALFAVGIQLADGFRGAGKPLAFGLAFKLVLAPLALWGIYAGLGAEGRVLQVTIFEAAMPPMITAAIVAREFHLEPRLAGLMVSLGVVSSFVSLPLWWKLLGG